MSSVKNFRVEEPQWNPGRTPSPSDMRNVQARVTIAATRSIGRLVTSSSSPSLLPSSPSPSPSVNISRQQIPTLSKGKASDTETFVHKVLEHLRLHGGKSIEEEDARKLARGLASGGKGLVEEVKVNLVVEKKKNARGEDVLEVRPRPYVEGERLTRTQSVITKVLPRQIHGIAGVNAHKDPKTGKVVVDIGVEELARGSSKRIKDLTRATSEGELGRIVRHTRTVSEKELRQPLEQTIMASDEQVEIRIRKDLKGVPGIVPIFVYEYLNEEGEYRKRFLSERCDGDIASLIFAKKKGTRGGLEPLPVGSRQTRKALRLLCDACSIFEQFHARHIAFLDLRLPNILMKDRAPMISDMGSCTHMGVPADARLPGDTEIRPPEVLFATHEQEPKLDKSLDIYAFGLALWEAYDPEGVGAFRAARRVSGGFTKGPEEFRQSDQGFLNVLRATEDPVKSLIADLLALEPTERPKSFGEVRERLDSAIKTLEQKGL